MSKKKLSAKNIAIAGLTWGTIGASFSASVSYITESPFLETWAWINGVGNIPLFFAASDALRQELGLKSPTQIVGNWTRRAFGRRIPVNADGKKTNIFMQTLSLAAPKTAHIPHAPVELETISIWYNENSYTLTLPEIEEFLYVAWRRQSQNKNGFSRIYWTRQRRPRLKTLEYNVRMAVLVACEGLIIDREEGRSGRLSISPDEAIKIIRSTY